MLFVIFSYFTGRSFPASHAGTRVFAVGGFPGCWHLYANYLNSFPLASAVARGGDPLGITPIIVTRFARSAGASIVSARQSRPSWRPDLQCARLVRCLRGQGP